MPKNSIIVALLIIIIAQSAYILIDFERESSAISERGKRESQLADSIQAIRKTLILTEDSLTIAFETIRQANYARQEAEEKLLTKTKGHEKIIYIRYPNDTLRASALSELYPSYGNP